MRILLVEPNTVMAELYAHSLNSYGHNVIPVTDAETAIAAVDAGTIDLLILEIQLALHNGVELLYELRSYSDLQKLPAIILSWLTEDLLKSSIDTTALAITEYLYKPTTSLSKLNEVIRRIPVSV